MSIYIRLKAFRRAHELKQSDLGEILGIGQTVISRMEKTNQLLNEEQYNLLVERFTKDEIDKFAGVPPKEYSFTPDDQPLPSMEEIFSGEGIPAEMPPGLVIKFLAARVRYLEENLMAQNKIVEAQSKVIESQSGIIEGYKKILEDMTKPSK